MENKKKAWLIYWPEEAVKNQRFIQMFIEKGMCRGWEFQYCSVEDYQNKELPDLVLNRTRQSKVSDYFHQAGVPVLHDATVVRLGNDKYQTLKYIEKRLPEVVRMSPWCPESLYLSSQQMEAYLAGEQSLPAGQVIKALDGHGGSQVFLTEAVPTHAIRQGIGSQACLLQKRVDSASQDLRVYILGGEIYASVLRTGGPGDFRSNYSLGGSVVEYFLTEAQREYVTQFIRCFQGHTLGMVGMDYILTRQGQLVFNELEEMVGSRMLYQCTDKDIVADYIDWIDSFV